VLREGEICAGDVVREAGGVDLRRPITNIMWGDTVALIKMAPRPISLVVAKELSPVPASVREEQLREQRNLQHAHPLPSEEEDDEALFRPSRSSTDQPVAPAVDVSR
jgi:hypothetical protein